MDVSGRSNVDHLSCGIWFWSRCGHPQGFESPSKKVFSLERFHPRRDIKKVRLGTMGTHTIPNSSGEPRSPNIGLGGLGHASSTFPSGLGFVS